MADATIPVDLFNPGQVFACLGIVEAADILLGDAAGVFSWDAGETSFHVSAHGSENPVQRVLRFIDEAEVKTRVPAGSERADKWKGTWGNKPERVLKGAPFPSADPSSPATLPAVLCDNQEMEIAIDYWAGAGTTRRDVKFWGGAGGYPGSALLRDAVVLVRGKAAQHIPDPFDLPGNQSSSFRFDWRRDYVPVDAGFSPNQHDDITMQGFPLVEIFAAIGVSYARPLRVDRLEYRYGVLGGDQPLDPIFLRAALSGTPQPPVLVPYRHFVMRLGRPSKHERCVTHVAEESSNEPNND